MKRETVSRIFRNPPTLKTERLILRRIVPTDLRDLYEYASDEEVPRYLPWSPHESIDYTSEYLRYLETRIAIGDFFDFAVVEQSSGKMIGTCGFTRFRYEDDCGEVGYVLNRNFWGKGYATEALRAVIAFGFERLPLARIEARFLPENKRTLRVMEKVGMTYEGNLRNAMKIKGSVQTIGICSILRDEFFGSSVSFENPS